MSKENTPVFTADDMIALRSQTNALTIIEAVGDNKEAEAIVTRARLRREMWETQSVTQKLTHRHRQRQNMDE